MAISLDGRLIISGGGTRESSIKIFDMENKKEIHHFENIHKGKSQTNFFFTFSSCRQGNFSSSEP